MAIGIGGVDRLEAAVEGVAGRGLINIRRGRRTISDEKVGDDWLDGGVFVRGFARPAVAQASLPCAIAWIGEEDVAGGNARHPPAVVNDTEITVSLVEILRQVGNRR